MNRKHTIVCLAALVAGMTLAGCGAGHRGGVRAAQTETAAQNTPQTAAETPAAPLQTDSLACENISADSLTRSFVHADFPVGEGPLADAVREYINASLAVNGLFYTTAVEPGSKSARYEGDPTDGEAMLRYYCDDNAACLRAELETMRSEERPELPELSCEVNITRIAETDRYLTYCFNLYCYLGGAHGSFTSSCTNFSRLTGDRITGSVDASHVEELQPLLRRGVLSYLHLAGEESATDANLMDYLLLDGNTIPLPAVAPYLAGDGLHFVYQQYEIAPYALGLVGFVIPYDDIRPYLTAEVQALVE